jgi:predicted secreted protein
MATKINGTNIVLYQYEGTTSTPFAAATNCTFQSTVDQTEITSLDSGSYKEFKNAQITWQITCDGMITIGNYDYKTLLLKMQTRVPIVVKFVVNNDNGGTTVYGNTVFTGTTNIISVNLTGPVENVSTYSVTLQGTGAYTIS